MKRHVRIALTTFVAVTVTLGFALAIGSTHSPLTNTNPQHIRPEAHAHTTPVSEHSPEHDTATLNTHADHTRNLAIADIHAHAQLHIGHYTARLDSFGGTHEWSHDKWDLHWLDVEHDGNVVRIYHATLRQHPHSRFIWMPRGGNPHQAAWEEVR